MLRSKAAHTPTICTTKTDAKGQVFTYSYDSYKRLTQVQVGSTVLRTFMYDTNTLDSTFSGSYTAGRLVAVQNAAFTPKGVCGRGGRKWRQRSEQRAAHRDVRLHADVPDVGQAVAGAGDL